MGRLSFIVLCIVASLALCAPELLAESESGGAHKTAPSSVLNPQPLSEPQDYSPALAPTETRPPDPYYSGMVFVRGGCFEMGDVYGIGRESERPSHKVCVSDFSIGRYEVTQRQWREVMGDNPSAFSDCGDDCPVENVSFNDAQEFLRRINRTTGNGPNTPIGSRPRRSGNTRPEAAATRKNSPGQAYTGTSTHSPGTGRTPRPQRTRSGRKNPTGWGCMT